MLFQKDLKISNFNSIGTILDRLVIETVKARQFCNRNQNQKVRFQTLLGIELQKHLAGTLKQCINEKYQSLKEERTFK